METTYTFFHDIFKTEKDFLKKSSIIQFGTPKKIDA